jgi:biopolymer transport protein ExbD
MAGVDTGGARGSKRSVDQEINMIPFIDLLMVTISFLLITAVWSSLARIEATARIPSPGGALRPEPGKDEPWVLHVRASGRDKKFHLQWQHGNKSEDIGDVDMQLDASGHYAGLETEMRKVYLLGLSTRHLHGDVRSHAPSELESLSPNQAVLHVDNGVPFGEVTRVLDAVAGPRRAVCFEASCPRGPSDVPAFSVAFSAS